MATDKLGREARTTLIEAKGLSGAISRTPEELAKIVSLFVSSDGWMDKVRLRAERRWYERLYHGPDYDIWVISWLPGQSTGFHDHGASSGAFVVATGILEEHRPGEPIFVIGPGQPRAFDPDYAHNGKFYTIHLDDPEIPGSAMPDNARLASRYEVTPPVMTPGPSDFNKNRNQRNGVGLGTVGGAKL